MFKKNVSNSNGVTMSKFLRKVLAITLSLLVACSVIMFPSTAGAAARLITYPQLSGIQGCQFTYTLQAKQDGASNYTTVPLYNALVTNQSGSQVNTTVANFDCEGKIDIKITFSGTVSSAAVCPASLNITPAISGNTITFSIPGPEKFYVDINGDHYNNCIHILANPIEVNPPQNGDPNVIFVPTGTNITNTITLSSGQTLYVQGGAAVAGVVANDVSNVKILGRGFIYRASYNALEAKRSSNVTIDGLIDLNHGWGGNGGDGLNCAQTNNLSISNTASFSSKKWGDGYNIFCSNGVNIHDVFIRTNDDAITFYGGGKSGYTGTCENVTVTNSVLLPDLAQAIHVGVYGDQNTDEEIRNVTVANVDIDDWSRTPGRPVIYFTVGDRVRAANFNFSNIRVTGYMDSSFSKSFIGMAVVYNSTYNYNPGREIDGVYFTNCSYNQSGYTPGSSINGYDTNRRVKNVYFTALKINGTNITSASQGNFNIGGNTSNVSNFALFPLSVGSTYTLLAKHSGKCAMVNGGATNDGAQIVQYTNSGITSQQWVLESAGNGFYKFKNVKTAKYMDVSGGSVADGANLIQWASGTGQNQQFGFVPQSGGYYSIFARHSGKFIDVKDASTVDGAPVIQWTYSGGNNQQWQIQ